MAPRGATAGLNAQQLQQLQQQQQWVTVSWMPHASLSQSSYISFRVRSLLACRNESLKQQPDDWQVKITIHGIAGLDLVPVASMTEFAPLVPIARSESMSDVKKQPQEQTWNPMVSDSTHKCQWDSMISIPLRWRDLPRDAYLKFQVTGPRDSVVRGKGFCCCDRISISCTCFLSPRSLFCSSTPPRCHSLMPMENYRLD